MADVIEIVTLALVIVILVRLGMLEKSLNMRASKPNRR